MAQKETETNHKNPLFNEKKCETGGEEEESFEEENASITKLVQSISEGVYQEDEASDDEEHPEKPKTEEPVDESSILYEEDEESESDESSDEEKLSSEEDLEEEKAYEESKPVEENLSSEGDYEEEEAYTEEASETEAPENSKIESPGEEKLSSEEEASGESENEECKKARTPEKPRDEEVEEAEEETSSAQVIAERPTEGSRTKKRKISDRDDEWQKKSATSRLWSERDELAVLKAMINYRDKYGDGQISAFYDYGKDWINFPVSREQLTNKIRKLKKKYETIVEKGEDPVFSRVHEQDLFNLSKKIWGTRKNCVDKLEKVDIIDVDSFRSMFPLLSYSLLSEMSKHFLILEEKISLIGIEKANQLEEKWGEIHAKKKELCAKRTKLIQEQIQMVSRGTKSSGS